MPELPYGLPSTDEHAYDADLLDLDRS